jgi:ribonucleoside-diphosphate reductase alpha chain
MNEAKRKELPERRAGYTQKIRVGGQKIYLHTGEYEDGSLGEIFLDVHKTGTALRSMFNAFALLFSLALQHGCPLEELVNAFKNFKFEPCGPVQGDPRIKEASSLLDYVVRELELTYLKNELPKEPEPEPPEGKVTGDYQGGGGF